MHGGAPEHLRLDGPVALERGRSLHGVTVAYHALGRLNPARDNAVVVCHALTGSSDVAAWWPDLIGDGRALDPSRDFILCANVLGGCYGTTGPGAREWEAVFADDLEPPP